MVDGLFAYLLLAVHFFYNHHLSACSPSLRLTHTRTQCFLQNADLAPGDRPPPYYPALCHTGG